MATTQLKMFYVPAHNVHTHTQMQERQTDQQTSKNTENWKKKRGLRIENPILKQ